MVIHQHAALRADEVPSVRQGEFMILDVNGLSHGFGDRAIFENVSFRLLAGEHIGLVGANGEGKSTFMNIVTGRDRKSVV